MTRGLFLASPEARTGKSAVAVGLLDVLVREVGKVGVFRPLVDGHRRDQLIDVLLARPGVEQTYDEAHGVTYDTAYAQPDDALAEILTRYQDVAERHDFVLVIGSDHTDVSSSAEHTMNAQIAANLSLPALMVVSGVDRSPDDVVRAAQTAIAQFGSNHTKVVAVVANRVSPGALAATSTALATLRGVHTSVIPELRLLTAPTVREQMAAAEATILRGDDARLDRESLGVKVAAMSLPNVLDRLSLDVTVIVPSDRPELLAGLITAHQSSSFPSLGGVILVGGYEIPNSITRLCLGVDSDLPIAETNHDTFETAQRLDDLTGPLTMRSVRKLEAARQLFADHVDTAGLLAAIDTPASDVRTPLMFQHQLMERARAVRRTIVLPESTDDRILTAADIVLRRGMAGVTLIGNRSEIEARAKTLGLDLSAASVVSNHDPVLLDKFATEYARLRAHKGITYDQAHDLVSDISYFGTMMVHFGLADGMVSGAINTTAHTIRPSLEFIKTKPGVTVVSSIFLMCLADRVLAYGDCAVIPDPTAEQLADIAISSAETAAGFDIEPRVAMLSYSTGASGHGDDVDKVRAAVKLVRERAPDLLLEGPIQYDAAIDPTVARAKLPDSPVAGRATVFVFPDLNTGNNTYKAVQRSAGAIAIGPILQGLNKPVNDLSRGALVDDIVNTIVITAIQAQDQTQAHGPGPRNTGPTDSRPMTTAILVINCGSSSVKYQLLDPTDPTPLASGVVEQIGEQQGTLKHRSGGTTHHLTASFGDHEVALAAIQTAFAEHGPDPAQAGLAAFGHRIVHGGDRFQAPTLLTDAVLAELEQFSVLAPLHNPPAISGVRAAMRIRPDLPQVGVFDTAFFADLPAAAYTYAIDRTCAEHYRIRRYGFHGTSHAFVSAAAATHVNRPLASLNQIVLHLGNGASASAIAAGRAVDTSMGMTPLEGLVMGTRSGDVDPGLAGYLADAAKMSAAEVNALLNERSGLLGLTGVNDFRAVQDMRSTGDPHAQLAYDVYVHRIVKYVGSYLAVLGGVDVLSFTAGVGENNPGLRSDIATALRPLGFVVDPERNGTGSGVRRISTDDSPTTILVVPTNEELAIAQAVLGLISDFSHSP